MTFFIAALDVEKCKNTTTNFFEHPIVSGKLPENWLKVQKMLGENWLIFALDPNLELDAETLVFHSGPKFFCFLVDFYKYFWFWCQTEIVSKKVYAVIWPVSQIRSLSIESHFFLKFRFRICRGRYNFWRRGQIHFCSFVCFTWIFETWFEYAKSTFPLRFRTCSR